MKLFQSLVLSTLLLAPLLFCGCSQEQALVLSDATLSGKILYKGKPVPYALVIVMGTSSTATANADDSGNYSVEHAPVGEVKIGVNTDAGRGHMMSATMAAGQTKDKSLKPTFVDLPKKFHDPTTSGLTLTITEAKGVTTKDIEVN
jgi:hypothetical protein